MSRTRVYIKPFDVLGNYVDDFIEVTDDVLESSVASIRKEIDSTEYNAGVFKFSNITLTLSNEHGKYSDVEGTRSIFETKRTDSIVKITWNPNVDDVPIAGEMILADSTDVVVFEGLISDEATTLNVGDQLIKFQCMGYESLFNRMEVPYGSLSAGDTFDEILLACLDQAPFNSLVTVSGANINAGTNSVTDAVASLENKTVKEALDELLVVGNAVLYIKDNVVYVSDRTASATLQYTFYGQASNTGAENIVDITGYRKGYNRVINYWTWQDSSNLSQDATSVSTYGVRKKEIGSDLITNSAKKDTILTALKDEFYAAKQELMLETGLTYTRLGLSLLDKIQVDYPTVFVSADDSPLPIYGISKYGSSRYPIGQWSMTLSTSTNFKIIGIKYNLRKGTITFKLREV